LSNALKFTPEGGSIRLQLEHTTDEPPALRLSVSDTGPGIPEDQQPTIFEKFKQIDGSVTREHGGAGLGLAITRELVHILGGTIRVESEPGQGSTFVVTLPAQAPCDPAPELSREHARAK
jgi:signal transduction histidine kinase